MISESKPTRTTNMIRTLVIISICFSVALAQEAPFQAKLDEVTDRALAASKSSAQVEENTTNRVLAASEATTKAVSQRHKRALELHKTYGDYLANLAAGETRPFPDIAENWEAYQQATSSTAELYKTFLETTDKDEKSRLTTGLLVALQPIGVVLRNASHGVVPEVVMTDALVAAQERLMNEFNTIGYAEDEGQVELVTPDTIYTLKHLPIPIQFTGPKETDIMLHSEVGGKFPNGLDYIKITTNEQGIAQTFWISNGDGVASCQINYRSPALTSKGALIAIVRDLNLIPLEGFSPIVKSALNKSSSILK